MKKIIINESQLKSIINDTVKNPILQECVVTGVRLGDGVILAKNRDRGYTAKVEVVHEILNDVELIYWHDVETDWSEGMNEYGIGIVNSSLMVHADEKEGKEVEKKRENKIDDKKKGPKHASDGAKIRQALTQKNIRDTIKVLISTKGDGTGKVKGVTGESIVSDGKDIYIIEHTSNEPPVIKKLKDDKKVVVRTNHGIFHKNVGYTHGLKKKSSHVRMETAKEHLGHVNSDQEVLDILKKQYHNDPFLNPYRKTNKFHMQTTGQIMMNLNQKKVTIRMDKEHGQFEGVEDLLPKGYKPKIKFVLEK